MPATARSGEGRHSRFLLALGIAGLGVFVGIEAASITVGPSYARIGPTFFPWIIGGGLLAIGLTLAWLTYKGLWVADADAEAEPIDTQALALVAVGLALQAILMSPAGFILASTVLFCFATRAFGSRKIVRDIPLALILTAITYAVFTFGLGLPLPAGLLAEVF